ncbi:zinc metallohydrolase [Sporosarcina newyorkensis 2681]|uniref:Zinc metallohydrolase n=1 Tax=Sporosarcina newyorkensis 2681 TaxID=1027292 RepID=F9DMK1_9BACL|nr:zinc metallohydrolase [Sporosarcina newyorkensis 2681]
MHNLRLENMSLSQAEQKKVLELINTNIAITPTLIKDLFKHGEI